jgi:hypothetical protein
MARDVPSIEVPALIDALVDAVAGKELTARLEVQIAIFNHAATSPVDAGRTAADHAYLPQRVISALVGCMGDAPGDDPNRPK